MTTAKQKKKTKEAEAISKLAAAGFSASQIEALRELFRAK